MNAQSWMRRAVELAEGGRYLVEPNPMVGAVIVKDGRVIGEGFHGSFGGSHAEPVALQKAGELARGADLYVTLEPCATFGKTPPCAQAVIDAGISRVFIGALDPSEANGGKGVDALKEAGVEVHVSVDEERARMLLSTFEVCLKSERPYVIAKWAMTLDGKIATRAGRSKWISSDPSRHLVHIERGRSDAVIVGVGTAHADDARLTCRLEELPRGQQPLRVVFDSAMSLDLDGHLARHAGELRTRVFARRDDPERRRALEAAGVQVTVVDRDSGWEREVLRQLRLDGCARVLVEGGAEVFTRLLAAKAIDQVMAFIAPKLVGGRDAKTPVEGDGFEDMKDALHLQDPRVQTIGEDVLIRAALGERA